MDDITLKQIEIFLTVAESLSFSEAARDLFIDQSVVSRWVLRLEANLGTALFSRHNKGIVLTSDGEFLYNEMKPVFTKLHNSIAALRDKSKEYQYIFKIGILDGEEVMAAFEDSVFQFRKLYPNVQLKISLYSFDELRREFINEDLDFAVSYYMGFGDYKNSRHMILKEKSSYYVLSKDSPAIEGGELNVASLGDDILYLVAPAEVNAAEEYMLGLCREQGFQPKKIKYLPNVLSIEIAVKNNQGFTIGSDLFLNHFPEELRLFRIPGTRLSESVAIFWRDAGALRGGAAPGFAGRFIETLNML
jgi:DNA-binding transcriptional LysR family regulator